MSKLLAQKSRALVLGLILIIAAGLRWYGLAWDDGYLFHPDERQILMVASELNWPHSLFDLFSPSSPLNPHFFAYGSFPIYFLRAAGLLAPPLDIRGPWDNDFLARWIVFGRMLSGLFDLGSVLMVYLLGRRLYSTATGLLASACLAVTVLSIQLSHFYAVDTLLTFFVLATLYAAARMAEQAASGRWKIACGVLLGLAMATKVSAFPLILPITLAVWHMSGQPLSAGSVLLKTRAVLSILLRPLLLIAGVALGVFVLTQPYAVIDGVQFLSAVGREALVARGWLDYPYTRQYANTIPVVYQVVQSAVWGMGLPLGIAAWAGGALFAWRACRRREWRDAFLLSWGLVYFLTIGLQYVKYPRYLLPLIPVLYVMATHALLQTAADAPAKASRAVRSLALAVVPLVLLLSLFYSVAFVSLYGREHPWLAISSWIYENARPGATLAVEAWDDALPVQLDLGGVSRDGGEYRSLELPIQDEDNTAKLDDMAAKLAQADMVIVASQRGYGSVGRLASNYPLTAGYYRKLFDGGLGFVLAATARNEPSLFGWEIDDDPRSGLPLSVPSLASSEKVWNWGFADESLTVYDHPQPLVFVKEHELTEAELRAALAANSLK